MTADTLDGWLKQSGGFYTRADDTKPSTLRARLRAMPPVELPGLWPNKVQAIVNLEKSLFDDRPRALIQMATGTGKTLLAVTEIYRLIKFGGARRVLFLVDRANLGEQAEKEFQGFRTPDDNRKFTELYNVQRLTSNTVGSSSKVVISTIQRLYSILKGEPELDPEAEEHTPMDDDPTLPKEPLPVVYSKAIPPEFFDVIFIDECHRSIYSLWRQVLEYFDAYLLGLTATPAKHTYGFFNQNVVMEYPHERAVADGVNCDYEVYRIRTSITAAGSTIEAAPGTMVGYRDRQTRKMRWEAPDEDVHYTGADLDRNVVATDQIRLIVQTFRDKVLKETFPDRTERAEDAHLRQGRLARRGHRQDRPRGVRQGERLLPEDHLQGDRRKARRPHSVLSQQLQPAHRRHGGPDRHGDGHQAGRDRHVHAERALPRAVRADEGPWRPRHQAGRTPGRHPRRQGQDALPHRGLRGRDREDAFRHQAAGEEPQRVAQGPARPRRCRRRERRLPLVARQPPGPYRQAVRSR